MQSFGCLGRAGLPGGGAGGGEQCVVSTCQQLLAALALGKQHTPYHPRLQQYRLHQARRIVVSPPPVTPY
eukprot:1195581-Prorocentrum_minimum.AAC.2